MKRCNRLVPCIRHCATSAVLMFVMCCSEVTSNPAAAGPQESPTASRDTRTPSQDADDIFRRFVEELAAITPGNGPFPQRPNQNQSFRIGRYETTQELYAAVMGNNPSRWQGARNSVESVSWEQAIIFCRRLTGELQRRQLLKEDEEVRLPTAAEWEYCCRAGTKTSYSFGDLPGPQNSQLDQFAWYTGNAAGNDPAVGVLKPNPWGLYDMHGYLWEYTAEGVSDIESESLPRQAMGGSWRDRAVQLTSDSRLSLPRYAVSDAVGFRCVVGKRVLPPRKTSDR